MFRQIVALIFSLLVLSTESHAARGFGTTYGIGSSDAVTASPVFTESANVSMSIWFVFHGSNNFGELGNIGRFGMFDANSATSIEFFQVFSTTNGAWTFPITAGTAWHHVCLSYNNSSTSNRPTVYLDNVLQTVTTATPPVGTVTTNVTLAAWGNGGAGTWDGVEAEAAIWNGTFLTPVQCSALYFGSSPLDISPTTLQMYLPMYGVQTGEFDWGPNRYPITVTGSKFQTHPRVQPSPNIRYAQ